MNLLCIPDGPKTLTRKHVVCSSSGCRRKLETLPDNGCVPTIVHRGANHAPLLQMGPSPSLGFRKPTTDWPKSRDVRNPWRIGQSDPIDAFAVSPRWYSL